MLFAKCGLSVIKDVTDELFTQTESMDIAIGTKFVYNFQIVKRCVAFYW